MITTKWRMEKIGGWLEEYRVKSKIQNEHEVLTSSRLGLIPQSQYYGESRITTRTNIGFHVIPPNYITYRSRSDDGLFFFNRNETGNFGIISHFYPVFHFPNGSNDFFLDALNFWRKQLSGYAVGSSQLVLSLNALKSIKIPIPPAREQFLLAEIFTTWNRAIEATEMLIANSEAQKMALMQKLLSGKRRLPGFKGKWKTTSLDAVVETDPEMLSASTSPEYSFKYISLSEVTPRNIDYNVPNITFASSPSRARKIAKYGDILMSTVRPNLQSFAKVTHHESDIIASTGFSVLRARQGTSIDFILHSLFSPSVTQQIDALVAGSNYPAISTRDVKKLIIRCPTLEEQNAIAALIDSAENSVQNLVKQRNKLKSEKLALMQQLLTGKRRVKIKEEETA